MDLAGQDPEPHHAADPISAAVQLISSAYHGLPRSVDSRDPAVLTFGSIHGGAARNVIPEEVRIAGTARTHSVGARETLERRLREIGAGVAALTGTRIDLTFRHGPDAIVNDPAGHRWEVISAAETGEEGCTTWQAGPRFGPLGALMNWWRVKVSGGCPLAP